MRAGLFFAAGAFLVAFFILIELLTDGIMTRAVMTWVPILQPSSAKRIKVAQGEVIPNEPVGAESKVNLAMFHLWPGLLALLALEGVRRTVATTVFFATLAAAVALSEHASSQMALIGSGLVVLAAWRWRASRHPRSRRSLVRCFCAGHSSKLHRLSERTASRDVAAKNCPAQNHPVGVDCGADAYPSFARRRCEIDRRLTARQKAAAPPDQPEGFVLRDHRPSRPQHFSCTRSTNSV